jgi:hypothetical protein
LSIEPPGNSRSFTDEPGGAPEAPARLVAEYLVEIARPLGGGKIQMGLASHALALGIGYVLGHPQGRARAQKVPGQLRELAARPEAQRLTEKGKAVAGQAVQTAKQRLNRSGGSGSTGSTGATGQSTTSTGTLTTGDTGRIATEEGARSRRRFLVRPRRRPGGIDAPVTAPPVVPSSGDPATDVRSVEVTGVSEETEAAMQGSLPPAPAKTAGGKAADKPSP